MADITTQQVLVNAARYLVMRFTDVSDGTGETGVVKVDATDPANGWVVQGQTIVPGTSLKITKVSYSLRGMKLRMQWQANTPEDALVLGGFDTMSFEEAGGIQNPGSVALPGATGSILFTTIGASVGDSYCVDLYMTKGTGSLPPIDGVVLMELEDGTGVWLWESGDSIQWG
jgi:hypothetical protein